MSGTGTVPPPADLVERAAALGVAFDPGDVERLGRYLGLLLEANQRFNLTAVKDPQAAWERHILDSLTLVTYLASAEVETVIDVGSGGGLPGVPLAVVMPDVRFTLLEATGKKTRFLESAAVDLGLDNVTVVNGRAEDAGQGELRGSFDAVTARAVGPLPVLLELTVPLARPDGIVLAVKGERAQDEIAAAKLALHRLHASVERVDRTPTGTIVVVRKLRPTPKAFPRRPGEPKRAPL